MKLSRRSVSAFLAAAAGAGALGRPGEAPALGGDLAEAAYLGLDGKGRVLASAPAALAEIDGKWWWRAVVTTSPRDWVERHEVHYTDRRGRPMILGGDALLIPNGGHYTIQMEALD